ncbi:MAG: ABC transporter permease [Symbiobacteriia bacterium]
MKRKESNIGPGLILAIAGLYLGIPILATFLFSIAGRWDSTVLPESYTFQWYVQMITDPGVLAAIGRSFLVSGSTVVLGLLVITPAAFITYQFLPSLLGVMRFLALLPYALPGVILAVGLIQLYSSGPLPIAGTFWILLFSYIIVTLPYMYNAIVNSLQAIDAKTMMEAAESLGANRMVAFLQVVVPNIRPGLVSAGLLTFAVSLGEFVLANMLVGGRFQTLQLVLEKAMHIDGHLSSAMVMLYFVLVAISSLVLIFVAQSATGRVSKAAGQAQAGTQMTGFAQ